MHPLVPLGFRVTVLITSVIALGLSASVHHLSDKYTYAQNPSTTMAIVVDVVAIPYILYITWDEYTGKPLGLRSPKAKIRLVLLDLFFIIFESANLSLAFEALTDDNGSCKSAYNGFNYVICDRVRALSAILLVALIAWSLTFSVSIFRYGGTLPFTNIETAIDRLSGLSSGWEEEKRTSKSASFWTQLGVYIRNINW